MIGIDTNILFYSLDNSDVEKHRVAVRIVRDILEHPGRYSVSLQVLGELAYTLHRKAGGEALETGLELIDRILRIPVSKPVYGEVEIRLSLRHRRFWDALLAYTYLNAGCTKVYTENIGDMPRIGGLEYVDPFKEGV